MKNRNEIEEKYKWDTNKFCENDEQCELGLAKIMKEVAGFKKFKGKLNNEKTLLAYLKFEENLELKFGPLYMYVSCNEDVDLSNSKYKELMGKCENIANKISVETSFFEPEILGLPIEYLKSLTENDAFKIYKFNLKNLIRSKKHVLSEKEETILNKTASFSSDYSSVHRNLTDVDLKYKDILDSQGISHPMNESLYGVYMEQEDRTLRKNASASLLGAYYDVINTLSVNYIANVKKDWFYASVSNFNSVYEAKTFGDNVSPKVYKTLVENAHKYLPMLNDYFKLKQQVLKYDEFYNYDMLIPISNYKQSYSYESACEIVTKALSVLGNDYVDTMTKAFSERWIDVYPTKNKRSGGYQNGFYKYTPVILLNYNGTLEEVFTIAHELGHAMNSIYSDNKQPFATSGYTIFVAEVASVVNEVILLKYLYKNAINNEEKIYYLDRYLRMFRGTFFTQVMFSEFEDYAHKLVECDSVISKDILNNYYKGLITKYNGIVKTLDEHGSDWTRIPHFYRSYYVYQYATGFVSAISIVNQIVTQGEPYLKKYKDFLSSGGSNYSCQLLKKANVNLETNDPYEQAFAEMKWAMKELKGLIK